MNREQEIVKAAEKMLEGDPKYMTTREIAFVLGAHWADEHPNWIRVEDELPKLNSGMVVVATYKGDIDFMIYSNSGWHNSKRWCCVKGVITHWMPLPAAPEKNQDND